ncbi:MAG: hypothetical protein A2Y56_09910 [Candidatus Aminicenantes bacterium RBG_13_63_10]|nr:MAG: hypothetical protein A2Y56_09910 [Candidatus Aminicenantes bacterium RBG_13_63_10]
MSVTLLAPGTNLIDAVLAGLEAEGKDYSRHWVVFPEQRPGHYLRRALARRAGSGFIPPRVDSLDMFVDRVYADHLGRSGRDIGVLDAAAMLFSLHRSAPDRLGRNHFLTADHFFPLGVKLWNDLEELQAAGLTAETLLSSEALTEENVPRETRDRLQSLAYFYEKFYAAVRDRGGSTRSTRIRDTAEFIRREQFPAVDRIVFAGFFSLTRTETALLRALLGWESFSLVLVEGKGIDALFDGLGLKADSLRPGGGKIPPVRPAPAMEFIKCPDTHGEVFALNKALESGLSDPARFNERQVVVLPAAETLFPLYQQTLSGLDERRDFNISLGYPLTRTPVYSFFHNLLELVQSMDDEGRIYVPAYLRFVLHPYTKNLYFPGFDQRTDLTRILFHAVEEELSVRKARAFWSLEEIESDSGVRESVQDLAAGVDDAPEPAAFFEHLKDIHRRMIVPFQSVRDTGDFSRKLMAVLDFVYENGTARQHHFFHPYAEAFRGQLDGLARSLLGNVAFQERMSYFHLFQRVMAGGTVPFFGTPLGGLQVLGFWETRGIPFEEVNILDMNEEVIPSFSKADSLLPLAARRALGLPTYLDFERRMEYYLDTLVAGASLVRFFFVENADKERSRFVEKLIWESEKRTGRASGSGRGSPAEVRTVQYEVALLPVRPRPLAKTREVAEFLRGFSFSATALDRYLRCPLQFYYGYILDLREKEEVGEDLEKKELGILVHQVLEEYFKPVEGRRLRPADLDPKRMEAVADGVFRQAFGNDLAGNAYLINLQARRHLRDFITGYQASLVRDLNGKKEQLKIVGLEERVKTDRCAGGRVFQIKGKVDRTETRGDRLFVLDYKTGANEAYYGINFRKLDLEDRSSWNKAVASLQLPFYSLLLAKRHDRPSRDIHSRLVMLGKKRLDPEIEFSPYDQEDKEARAAQIETMEGLIDQLLQEIVNEDLPFDPGPVSVSDCESCPYAVLCSRHEPAGRT